MISNEFKCDGAYSLSGGRIAGCGVEIPGWSCRLWATDFFLL